jgi:cytochrome c551/c552
VNDYLADQGNANTCIQCHQSRIAEPILDLGSTDDVTLTNKRYGPHHGPQGNMLIGAGNSGAYEIDGSMSYANSMHATSTSVNCVSCHMASTAGSGGNNGLGEHSNNVGSGSWEDGDRTINANGCVACHSTLTDNGAATDFVSGARDANLILIDNLRTALYDLGYLDDEDYVANGNEAVSSSNPLVVSQAHAAAIYNFKFLTEDQSTLIHNPNYAKALLQNSIEAVQ